MNDSITVTDDTRPGEQWTFNDTGSFSYPRTFTCDGPYQGSR
ncbi:MAG: hypothetical protein M5R40_13025 [Anaerolineae bacterium]|nr:hypothetical protein [Anaerolineae bacterium]